MKKPLLFTLFLLLLAIGQTQAQATLSFQGVLKKNSTGGAVDDGKYDLTFQLYETTNGGTAIWSETQAGVDVIGGVYAVLLGEVTPLDVPFDAPYYLGVAVDGSAELTPRVRLTASPYALSLLGETNVFPNDGNVGIGTDDPLAKLHVVGDVKIDGNLETTGGLGFDFGALTVDINTTENMSADSINANKNVTMADSLFAPAAYAGYRMLSGYVQMGTPGTQSGPGWTGISNAAKTQFTITFDEPFSSKPTCLVSTEYSQMFVRIHSVPPFEEAVVALHTSSGPFASGTFNFLIIGPR